MIIYFFLCFKLNIQSSPKIQKIFYIFILKRILNTYNNKIKNKMGCKTFFNIIDIYSIEYKLRFKGNKNYNSLLGKMIGGFSILIFITLFINFMIEFI